MRHPVSSDSLFLLSLPRTGSTLLRLILDTHPDIYCPDELLLGRLGDALYFTLEGLNQAASRDDLERIDQNPEVLAQAREVIQDLMGRRLAQRECRIWCDKSPGNLRHLPSLPSLFPSARYITLHRHCLDFVSSCIECSRHGYNLAIIEDYAQKDTHNFVAAMIQAWVDETEKLLEFEAKHKDRTHRTRYEDLVGQPQTALESLFGFLGLSLPDGLLDHVFTSGHHQRAYAGDGGAFFSTGIRQDRLGVGRALPEGLIGQTPGWLLDRMRSMLERLEYTEVPVAAGGRPAPPSPRCDGAAVDLAPLFTVALPDLFARPETDWTDIQQAYRFTLSGPGGGDWVLDPTRRPGGVMTPDHRADCTIRMTASDFMAILSGALNPAMAYREQRADVEGDLDLPSLQRLLSRMAAAMT